MSFDAGEPVPAPESIDLWRLPEVLQLRVRRRRFDPPHRVTTRGVDREVREAVEIEIRVSEPFVIRALGPVLWVGDQALTIAEGEGNLYRFLAFEPDALEDGAPIALAWNSPSSARAETSQRYQPPSEE